MISGKSVKYGVAFELPVYLSVDLVAIYHVYLIEYFS